MLDKPIIWEVDQLFVLISSAMICIFSSKLCNGKNYESSILSIFMTQFLYLRGFHGEALILAHSSVSSIRS